MNKFVGVIGFEPTTSSSRTKRANRTAPHPDEELEIILKRAMQI